MDQNLRIYALIKSKLIKNEQYKQVRLSALFATLNWLICMLVTCFLELANILSYYGWFIVTAICVVYLTILYLKNNTRKKLVRQMLAAHEIARPNINQALKKFDERQVASFWTKSDVMDNENKLEVFNHQLKNTYLIGSVK